MIAQANSITIPLADESVQCVVTSPPYWGLRKYAGVEPTIWGGLAGCWHSWEEEHLRNCGNAPSAKSTLTTNAGKGPRLGDKYHHSQSDEASTGQFCHLCNAWRGCLGLEPTPELFVEHLVGIFREVKRVLRTDGTVWLNLGSSYANTGTGKQGPTGQRADRRFTAAKLAPKTGEWLKPKDLVMIPHMVALALQRDGWWVRSTIVWAKPNPMPESVTDRPTRSHEYVFLLTKAARYAYDADAIREPYNQASLGRYKYQFEASTSPGRHQPGNTDLRYLKKADNAPNPAGRNRRTVWSVPDPSGFWKWLNLRLGDAQLDALVDEYNAQPDVWTIPTHSYKGSHFATFPPALVTPCILAGTSAKGACPVCGAGWRRVVEKAYGPDTSSTNHIAGGDRTIGVGWEGTQRRAKVTVTTTGWRPTCNHYPETDLWQEYPRRNKYDTDEEYSQRVEPIRRERARLLALWEPLETRPALTLDPFAGSGTVGMVARELGRRVIGLDLSGQYLRELALPRAEKKNTQAALLELPLFAERGE